MKFICLQELSFGNSKTSSSILFTWVIIMWFFSDGKIIKGNVFLSIIIYSSSSSISLHLPLFLASSSCYNDLPLFENKLISTIIASTDETANRSNFSYFQEVKLPSTDFEGDLKLIIIWRIKRWYTVKYCHYKFICHNFLLLD